MFTCETGCGVENRICVLCLRTENTLLTRKRMEPCHDGMQCMLFVYTTCVLVEAEEAGSYFESRNELRHVPSTREGLSTASRTEVSFNVTTHLLNAYPVPSPAAYQCWPGSKVGQSPELKETQSVKPAKLKESPLQIDSVSSNFSHHRWRRGKSSKAI